MSFDPADQRFNRRKRPKIDRPPCPAVEYKVDAFIAYGQATRELEDELAENAGAVMRALATESRDLLERFTAWVEARERTKTCGKVQRHGATRVSEDGALPVRMGARK